MGIKKPLGILSFLALFLIFGPSAPAKEAVQICTFEYPLFMSKKPIQGKGFGFLIDCTNAALDAVGLEPNYHFFPMKRSIKMAANGEYDAFLGTVAHFPEETRTQFSSIKMGELHFVLFYLKDRINTVISFSKLEELKKYRIGTVRGSSSVPILQASGIALDLAQDLETNFKKLFAKRIDLCAALELPARYIIDNLSPSQQSKLAKIEKPIMSISVDFIVHKNSAKSGNLSADVENGLQLIKDRGIYRDIVERYYGKDRFLRAD